MKVHASHILIRHQYEAEDLLKKIQKGESFEDLARKWSLCPSGKEGGDLGPIEARRLDEDFVDGYLKLKKGEISSVPIRTSFGFHLIRREID